MRSASARCSTEYQKAPAVTRDRLYIETMQQVYSNVSKVMVDSRNGSNLLYLPLDRLLQQGGAHRRGRRGRSAAEAAQPVSAGSGHRCALARRRRAAVNAKAAERRRTTT